MFFGQFEHNIDEKGRITIPARYRGDFDSGAFITRGFEQNLLLMRADDFQSLYHKIKGKSITNPKAQNLSRFLFSNATLLDLDKAGRILLPSFLRTEANLESAVILVGNGPIIEIWSPENWANKQISMNEQTSDFEELDITF